MFHELILEIIDPYSNQKKILKLKKPHFIVWISVFISALYFLAGLILLIISLLVIVGLVAVGLYYIWTIGFAIAAFAIILVGIFMALGVLYKFSTYLGSWF